MDYGELVESGGDVMLTDVRNCSLPEILECGQCFRWTRAEQQAYSGIAFGRRMRISWAADTLTFHDTTAEQFDTLWRDYFDFTRDYGALKAQLRQDAALARAVDFSPGMRVLRQEPWEALCTFIISQNNNIKRIRQIVERLCEAFGESASGGGYAFPTAVRLAGLEVEELAPLRSGFRAKYILDAAKRVASGEIDLSVLQSAPLEQAKQKLMTIYGVGSKVADCALLYGLHRVEAFPVDVWIRRALQQLYPQGFPAEYAAVAGLAQQYLFHYMRCAPDAQK